MIILSLTLVAMLLGLICRFGWAGLARLATLELRSSMLAVLACTAQMVGFLTRLHRLELLIVSTVFFGWFCWRNRRQAGIPLVSLGIVLNMTVMAANGGMMPIAPAKVEQLRGVQVSSGVPLHSSKDVVREDSEAALAWLGDRIVLPGPLAKLAVWSIGDFVLLIGVGRLLWTTMEGRERERFTNEAPVH